MWGALPGRPGPRALRISAADGSGVVRELPCPEDASCEPTDWTTDGDLIVTVHQASGSDVWRVPVDAGRAAEPVLAERFNERDARVSANGLWIAYVSDEHRRPEVFVRSLSGAPFRTSISAAGGSQPVWSRDGTQLYFVDPGGGLRAVPVSRAGDGRLYFIDRDQDRPPDAFTVVLGWRALLDSRAAVRDRAVLR